MSEQKKRLEINTAMLDATKVTAQTLDAYSSIHIDAAMVLTNARAQELLAHYAVSLNTAASIQVSEDCTMMIYNGHHTLSAANRVMVPTALIVNGNLTLTPGCGEALASYEKLLINGTITAPQSVYSAAFNLLLNGSCTLYPDDAVLLNQALELDDSFIQRAEPGRLYYCTGPLRATQPGLDVQALADKAVRFQVKRALLRAEYEPALLPLLDIAAAKVRRFPENAAYVAGGATLNRSLLLRHGARLFVDGALKIPEQSRDVLEQLTFLQIEGAAQVHEALEDLFLAKCDSYGSCTTWRGIVLEDQGRLELTAAILEEYAQGVTVRDCGQVTLEPDLPLELLRARLIALTDCGVVVCTKEQKAVLASRSSDVGQFKSHADPVNRSDDVHYVNAAQYAL